MNTRETNTRETNTLNADIVIGKFIPSYKDDVRICDKYGCEEVKLSDYYNDAGLKLKFCSKHTINPYGDVSEIVPIFDKANYRTHDKNEHRLCEYVGCNQSENLKFIKGYWCAEHGKIITSLRF